MLLALVGCFERRPSEAFKIGFLDIGVIDRVLLHTPEGEEGSVRQAALLAVKHVNDAGGVWGRPVEVAWEETFVTLPPGDRPVEAALQLVDADNVHGIVGPIRSVDTELIVNEVIKPRPVPIISFGTAPYLADLDDGGYHFRTVMNDEAQGLALARLANEEHDEHVALVHLDTVWGRDLARVFKSHFDGRVSEVSLHPEADSFADELHELSASDAPVLVMIMLARWSHEVLDEVVAHGHFDHVLLIAEHRSLELLADYPEFLDGSKGVAPIGKHIAEAIGHWEEDFEAEYGHRPSQSYAREAYDAAVLLMLAAEHAGSNDPEAIRDSLYEISRPPGQLYPATSDGVAAALRAVRNGDDIDLDGESSALDWDDRGEVTVGHFSFWQFQDGEIVDLEHVDIDIRE